MAEVLIQSLVRGLEMLEAVAAADQGLALTELASRLELKSPTAFNLAKTLVAKGYMEKSKRPLRYRLGPAASGLARLREKRHWLEEGDTVIRALSREFCNSTVLLGESFGGEITPSLRMDSTRPDVMERNPGWAFPPYSSVIALCFQAFWAEPERAAYQRRHAFAEYGLNAWVSEERLAAFLADARRHGIVETVDQEAVRVAAPVFGSGTQLVASLGISFHLDGAAATSSLQQQIREAVLRGAGQLSACLQDN